MLGLVLTTLATAHELSGQNSGPRLDLEQVAQVELPAGFNVTGGLLTEASGAIVWGPGGLVRIDTGKDPQLLVSGKLVKIRGVQVVDNDSARYLVMGAEGGLFNVGSDGQISHVASCQIEGEVVQAVPLGDQWLIQEYPSQEGIPMLLRWRPIPGATTRGERLVASDGEWEPPFRLFSIGGTAFVQEMGRPYQVLRIEAHRSSSRLVSLLSREAVQESLVAHDFPSGKTAALPMLALDEGYLLQFSDLGGDRRLMITLDSDFRIIRSAVVPAPLGFVAAAQESRELLALVDTGIPELRFYRWRWSGSSKN